MANGQEQSDSAGQEQADATACAPSAEPASDDVGAAPETAADAELDAEASLRAALDETQAALDAALAKAAAEEDRALRAAAEAENVRKRAERSIENARKFALEKFVADLLPAVDSFERAAAAAAAAGGEDGAMKATAEGIELSLKLLAEALARQGIEAVDPIGAPFDPALHEAMTMLDNAEAEPGTVIDVFQKGYTVNGRLARPARVIVARAPANDAPPAAVSDDETGPAA